MLIMFSSKMVKAFWIWARKEFAFIHIQAVAALADPAKRFTMDNINFEFKIMMAIEEIFTLIHIISKKTMKIFLFTIIHVGQLIPLYLHHSIQVSHMLEFCNSLWLNKSFLQDNNSLITFTLYYVNVKPKQ